MRVKFKGFHSCLVLHKYKKNYNENNLSTPSIPEHAFPLICIHMSHKLEEIQDERTVINILKLKINTKAISLETLKNKVNVKKYF